ncbi:nucleotidyltransferase family protein [Halomonas sp. McH1-25]|uniref:nucleotidyltransferase family protein n=1 Tax=unclassified Halomonas TaxID=2609666 RepID=UPI001EF72149|nr:MULTISPECIES: nucleotidyltransferase family protein [unclassified Halomonas]MCG7600228.1 nucleotidyltransferase family protein [Halomonas sp. McH1-25]MCP1343101.1 nucleotidyltransferase family protein [Halomonas sp. FL8]MCP1360490.1 nucleotidyltransferase family protein [Halomonas sp. BBD45]MCP1365702.1 nucleotidyltransferase family protein [Halomonas sp. BBD48]
MTTPIEETLIAWIEADPERKDALRVASQLQLNDWCLAAGFVRNLVWDRLHGYSEPTPLDDIDLIYFDSTDITERRDRLLESRLHGMLARRWSVKNQARMHAQNGDAPYHSMADAMTYWVELETAVGVRLIGEETGVLEIIAPLGLESLFNLNVTMNPKRKKPEAFADRVQGKGWKKKWPNLVIEK